jgi:hypothetical protein
MEHPMGQICCQALAIGGPNFPSVGEPTYTIRLAN